MSMWALLILILDDDATYHVRFVLALCKDKSLVLNKEGAGPLKRVVKATEKGTSTWK